MTVKSSTGSELPDLFHDPRHAGEHPIIVDWLLTPAPSFAPAAMASATVSMHVRDGIALSGLSAGVLITGTASGDEAWAGALVAARGCVRLLDSGHITDEGLRQPVLPRGQLTHFGEFRVSQAAPRRLDAWQPEPEPSPVTGFTGSDDDNDDPDPPPESQLARLARAMTGVPAAVAVERPRVPDLTDEPAENVRRLFALTVGQLADLFGVTERHMHRYLREGLPEGRRALADALTAVGLTVIGGLGAPGARRWLYSGEPTAAELARQGRIAELAARAEALRDSPAT